MNKLRAGINQDIEEVTGKIDATNERLEEAEQRIRDMETWSTGAKDAVSSLLRTQRAIQGKVTKLEGHSCRNNIRLYGVRETAEGTSAINFVEKLIRTKLFEDIQSGMDLGIKQAHRALGTRPLGNATPKSIL